MYTIQLDSRLKERLTITAEELVEFCQRWQVAELALFGSVLRDDFHADSDIDVLVSYQTTAKRGLFEKMHMQEELELLLHRKVDLVSKKAIEHSHNWLRRKNILDSAEVIYDTRSEALIDIVEAIKLIFQYVEGVDVDTLTTNIEKQDAILRRITIIGEATKRLSKDFREQHPTIPWREIAGMRDVVTHDYDEVDLDEVWTVVNENLPQLLAYIEPLTLPER